MSQARNVEQRKAETSEIVKEICSKIKEQVAKDRKSSKSGSRRSSSISFEAPMNDDITNYYGTQRQRVFVLHVLRNKEGVHRFEDVPNSSDSDEERKEDEEKIKGKGKGKRSAKDLGKKKRVVEDFWKKPIGQIGEVLKAFHFSKPRDVEKFPNFIEKIRGTLGATNSFNHLVSAMFDNSMDELEKHRYTILSLAPQGNRKQIAKWKVELDERAAVDGIPDSAYAKWINMIDDEQYFERIVDIFCKYVS